MHLLGERELGGVPVAHPVDGEAVLREAVADRLADHRVVFGEQQAHRAGDQSLGSNLSAAELMQ